jgi:hypothetical protein
MVWTVAYRKTGNLPLPEILRLIEVIEEFGGALGETLN